MTLSILVVEDNHSLCTSIVQVLGRHSYNVRAVGLAADAIELVQQARIDVLLLDIKLPDGSGLDVLGAARNLDESVLAIMMTAFPEVSTALTALKSGAYDYLIKPFELDELLMTVRRGVEALELRRRVERLERQTRVGKNRDILGESPAIAALRERIGQVASSNVPVLILGETGVGKELVAESVHRFSERHAGPLVKVNCSAISEQLLESELFGHEKGAFTDAREARAGLFEMAEGGTLFLDEISEMRADLQAKLLRVVERQPFRRVGGRREIHADTRVITATNRDLVALMERGRFRRDLFYRLNVFPIHVPPLRERGQDVIRLARYFLEHSNTALRRPAIHLDDEAEAILLGYHWPGNVRELRNIMERGLILAEDGRVGPQHLPSELQAAAFVRQSTGTSIDGLPTLAEVEQRFIEYALDQLGGNISEAARVLGIARNTLKARLRRRVDPVQT